MSDTRAARNTYEQELVVAATLEQARLNAKSSGASSRSREGVRWRTLRGEAAAKSWLRQRALAYRSSAARANKNAVFCHRPRAGGQRTEDGKRNRATVDLQACLHARRQLENARAAPRVFGSDRPVLGEHNGASGYEERRKVMLQCASSPRHISVCHRTSQLSLLPSPQRRRYRGEAGVIARGGDVGRDARLCRNSDVGCD
jgi:hypothetical protein